MSDKDKRNRYRDERESDRSYGSEAEKSKLVPKAFVRGGKIDPTAKTVEDKDKGDIYIPTMGKAFEEKKSFSNIFEQFGSQKSTASSSPGSSKSYTSSSSKPKQIDKFVQEIKTKKQVDTTQKKSSQKQPEKPKEEPCKLNEIKLSKYSKRA